MIENSIVYFFMYININVGIEKCFELLNLDKPKL